MAVTSDKYPSDKYPSGVDCFVGFSTDNPPVTPPAPNDRCSGLHWLLNGSKCLLFRPSDYRTYLDATIECQNHHASLVSVHSMAQNQFLLQTIKAKYSVQTEGFWAGLHKSQTSKLLINWIFRVTMY